MRPSKTDRRAERRAERPGEVRDRWVRVGLSTEPADRPAAEAAIAEAYWVAGLRPPRRVIWTGSPRDGCLAVHLLSGAVPAEAALSGPSADRALTLGEELLAGLDSACPRWLFPDAGGLWNRLRDLLWEDIPAEERYRVNVAAAERVLQSDLAPVSGQVLDPTPELDLGRGRRRMVIEVVRAIDRQIGAPILQAALRELHDPDAMELWAATWAELIPTIPRGQHSIGTFARIDLAVTTSDPVIRICRAQGEVARHCGWWWPLAGVAVATDRPERIVRDGEGRLHSATGPVVRYRDGWEVFAWNGVAVPAHAVLHPERITSAEISRERNVEVRRILMERYGLTRFFRESGARVVHKDPFGKLLRIDGADAEPVLAVRVRNATPEPDGTLKEYLLRVPPWVQTARDAVAWTFGMRGEEYLPEVET